MTHCSSRALPEQEPGFLKVLRGFERSESSHSATKGDQETKCDVKNKEAKLVLIG